MEMIKKHSLAEKREDAVLPKQLEQEITDLELDSIEQEQNMTDMELDILELQQKVGK
jgi:hypothetical protein